MKKGQICEGVVSAIAFPNRGKIHTEDGTVEVKNALPGQTVSFRVTKKKNSRLEGSLLEVVKPAPEEIPSPCPHFGICGGCLYLSLPYERQLAIKERQVRDLLDGAAGGDACGFEGILPSPRPFGYRNKMEFSFGDMEKDGPLCLGFHRRGSFYDVVTAEGCRIADDDFSVILRAVLEWFAKTGDTYYHKRSHEGFLRHLLVRKAARTGEILVALVTSSQGTLEAEGFINTLTELPLSGSITGILHVINDSMADVVRSDETRVLYGRDWFYEELLGLRFRISPFSFFQTNSLGAQVLYEKVRSYVGETRDQVVFDLYSGTGTIAQLLAPVAKKVVGVEIVEEAVNAARENAAMNGLDNCEFIAGDVLKVLDDVADKPDIIVLDPPRDGVHPKALKKILAYGVEKIVYISCKPTSLARDLAAIREAGYRVEKSCCVDMFPWTGNVETVCVLSKLNVKQHIEVELTMDEMDLTAAEKKASYEEIKEYVLEKFGMKVSHLYIAQVKRKCGIIERENYNKPKSEDSKQPQCPPEKEAAIRAALEHFGMIY